MKRTTHRRGSSSRSEIESRVGRGDEETNDEGTENVEEENSDVHSSNRLGKIPSRVLGLTGGDGDDLSSNVRLSTSCQHSGSIVDKPKRKRRTNAA